MKYNQLGQTDLIVSQIGFGGSVFSNFYKDSDYERLNETAVTRARSLLNYAFEQGINYIDTAPWYQYSEYVLGKALEGKARNTYYIGTKVGRYNSDKSPKEWFDFTYKRVKESVENSLRLLGCGYIDLIQVHDFEFCHDLNQILTETLPALNELRLQGKVKYIGINSYDIELIQKCLQKSSVKIDTVCTYSHLCLDDDSLLDYIAYFKEKGVGIINASPYSMGLYTDSGPPDWHQAKSNVKQAVREAFVYCKKHNLNLKKLEYGYSTRQPGVDTTLSSFATKELLDQNVKYFNDWNEVEDRKLCEMIQEKFFIKLNNRGWGDLEVQKFLLKLNN